MSTLDVQLSFARAQHIIGGATGSIPYQTATSATAFTLIGSNGTVLTSNGTTATWTALTNLSAGTATNIQTIRQPLAATYYLTFVDSDNASATGELVYTSSTIYFSPAYGMTLTQSLTVGNNVLISGTTNATSTTTGALVVTGGAGIGQNLYVGGGTSITGLTTITNTTNATSTNTGALRVAGGAGIGQNLYVGGGTSITGLTTITNTTNATSTTTGALVVTGGAGIGQNLYVGGDISAAGATLDAIRVGVTANNEIDTSAGNLILDSANGTVQVDDNLIVTGNLTVQGATTIVDSTVTNVSDPIFLIGTTASGGAHVVDDSKDRGIAFAWHNGTTARTGFFGFDRSTQYFTFFTSATIANELVSGAGGTSKGAVDANLAGGSAMSIVYQSAADTTAFLAAGTAGNVLQTNGTGAAPSWVPVGNVSVGTSTNATNVATVRQPVGATYYLTFVDADNASATFEALYTSATIHYSPTYGLTVTNTTNATSTVTGAFRVAGGVGIGQNLYVGGGTSITGLTTVTNATNATSTTTGALVVTGGAGIGQNLYAGGGTQITGLTTVTNTTNATSTNSGALQIAGGVGIGQNLYAGGGTQITGLTTITNTTNATSTITGALRVVGGVGIGQNLHVGGGTQITGLTTITNTTNATSTNTGALEVDGGVGIGQDLWVGGGVFATTKSFLIDHPTKPGMKLRYGSLEGPENGVYVRGRLKGNNKILLPEYWSKLVDEGSITVQLTPIGNHQTLFVENVSINEIKVSGMPKHRVDCYYTIFAERNDVSKLDVEILE